MRQFRSYALSLLLLLLATSVFAFQQKLVESESYSLKVPEGWEVRKEVGPGPEFSFNMMKWSVQDDSSTQQILPKTYEHQPVLASGFIVAIRAQNLDEAVQMTDRRNRSLPDRKFERDTVDVEMIMLKGRVEAGIVKTRSTRMSKKMQQTRYDLFVSSKAGHVYNVALLINYADPTFEFEKVTSLDKHVRSIFRTFELKQ